MGFNLEMSHGVGIFASRGYYDIVFVVLILDFYGLSPTRGEHNKTKGEKRHD
jgi:hypothetical protein